MTGATQDRPFTLLIAALGGEGGGLLTDWIVEACRHEGVLVQSTSIPGVAQRTGATTYYLEAMRPAPDADREPLFGLYPAPGYVDVAVASEMIEAGRLVEAGFVTPERTTLVASTHRVYAMAEKTAMADAFYNASRIADAANALAKTPVLNDFQALAKAERTAINAVLLGAISTHADCPVSVAGIEHAITERGVAVEANIRGFRAGRALVNGEIDLPEAPKPAKPAAGKGALHERAETFPADARDVIHVGIDRVIDFQDVAYGEMYLERLDAIASADTGHEGRHDLTRETARYLALWMAYEDVIRVADLKSRASRLARVRADADAKPAEPVRITEFLKPGVDEAATILPASLGRRLTGWTERRGLTNKLHVPLHIRTDTVWGYALMRLMAGMKRRRRKGLRFAREQEMIDRWLRAIPKAAQKSYAFGRETAECGRLIKGYSDTRERAFRNFDKIFSVIVEPGVSSEEGGDIAAHWLRDALAAALTDEDGKALEDIISAFEAGEAPHTAQAAE